MIVSRIGRKQWCQSRLSPVWFEPVGQLVIFVGAGYEAGAALSEAEAARDAAWHMYNSMCVN